MGCPEPSARAKAVAIMVSMLAATFGVFVMAYLASSARMALSIIPFTTSIALVAGAPTTAPASTRSILVGHVLSAVIGLLTVKIFGVGVIWGAFAVGVSVAAMLAMKSFHPPAAISPLLICEYNLGIDYLFIPVLVGALLVVILSRCSESLQKYIIGSDAT